MKYADYDLFDGKPGAERHHCLSGNPNRHLADDDGLWVPLSSEHHRTGKISAHGCMEIQKLLQIIAQLAYELEMVSTGKAASKEEAKELFRVRYGKTYV